MFPSFTGSTRPRRQVNLSGRNNNPFATLPGSSASASPSPQAGQNALAQAQQERIVRQQERERPPAATRIQKTWRGYRDRKEAQKKWRKEWDQKEAWDMTQGSSQHAQIPSPYTSGGECLSSLRLLLQFASPLNEHDVQRLKYFATRYLRFPPTRPSSITNVWKSPLLRLAKLILATLSSKRTPPSQSHSFDGLLALLGNLASAIPEQLATFAQQYFKTLIDLAVVHEGENFELLQATALGLLQSITTRTAVVYEGFANVFLTTGDLPTIFGSLEVFAQGLKYEHLAEAINKLLSASSHTNVLQVANRENLLWLLAYFIYFHRCSYLDKRQSKDLPNALYVKIVSRLISFLADDIGTRIEPTISQAPSNGITPTFSVRSIKPLPAFVRSEILTLINQENVSSLLANLDITPQGVASGTSNEAAALASYALTLLRAFPRRGDEIRMWLYRGSTSRQTFTAQKYTGGGSLSGDPRPNTLPAIKYFYRATSRTDIFRRISEDPRETVSMLRPERNLGSTITTESRDEQWRVILLFLELYTFVLKVMDDEEFLSGTSSTYDEQWSWTRKSALPLDQVRDLTQFLKNLAFSMYWNTSEIAGIEATQAKTSLAEYFGNIRAPLTEKSQDESPAKYADVSIAGVSGMTLAYMKGMVTGVLRMLYERE